VDVLDVQIDIGIGVGTSVDTLPADLTPASVEVANATYYPKAPVPGLPLYVTSKLGKICLLQYVDQPDGTAIFMPTPLN
jgi:hypothetical protein